MDNLSKTQEDKVRKIIDDNVPKSIKLNGKSHYISKKKIEKVRDLERKEGGFLPLAALLPLIFAGVGAAGGVAGGAASIAKTIKDTNENERHNKEMEKLASSKTGDGISSAIKSFAKKSGLEKESRRLLKEVLNNLADTIEIKETKDGTGLYLKPYGSGLYINPP
jgi:hypothetical protein